MRTSTCKFSLGPVSLILQISKPCMNNFFLWKVKSDTLLAPSITSICALEKRGIYSGCVTFYRHVSLVLFVWADALRPGSTAKVMSGRSVSYPPCSWASLPEAGNQYLAHILSPLTDNWSSWISGRGRMAVEIISWPNLHEKMCWTRGSIAVPLDSQVTSLLTEL